MHNNQYSIIIRMYTHTETHTDYVQLTITVNLKFFLHLGIITLLQR